MNEKAKPEAKGLASEKQPPAKRPAMGASVDEVLKAFISRTREWSGIEIVEAAIPVTLKGPARFYRVLAGAEDGTVMGVSEFEGTCLRPATAAEESELEESLALGYVQITSWNRITRKHTVLHQATGRAMPMRELESA